MCMASLKTIYETSKLFMKSIYETPPPPLVSPPPESRQTLIFVFSSLYTSMVTKNKFFTFPARLTPPLAPGTIYFAGNGTYLIW